MKAERRTMAPGTARNTASRTSPLVAVEMPSRASNAVLTVASREARDIEISLASDFVGRGALSGFGDGESRLPTASSQRTSPPVIAGLDPAIHPFRRTLLRSLMDARIKSGHDG